jgi:hypothetical protein
MRRRLDAKVHAMSETYPLMAGKDYLAPSVFEPENLLREARRQRGLVELPVPAVCLLDPDGDIVRYLKRSGRGHQHEGWACYHTEMWIIDVDGLEIGVVGMAVGAPFAVLVAEQLAVSGARLTISVTSAGRVATLREPPYFVLIDRAARRRHQSSLPATGEVESPRGVVAGAPRRTPIELAGAARRW